MKKYLYLPIIATACIITSTAFAGAWEYNNEKMHCAIFKNGKLAKQQNCIADGYEHAGAVYGGGAGWEFKAIPGYGKISVDWGFQLSETKTDPDGGAAIEKQWLDLNEKPAVKRHRIAKSYKLLTTAQETLYEEGKLTDKHGKNINVYSCFYQKANPAFEFCFNQYF